MLVSNFRGRNSWLTDWKFDSLGSKYVHLPKICLHFFCFGALAGLLSFVELSSALELTWCLLFETTCFEGFTDPNGGIGSCFFLSSSSPGTGNYGAYKDKVLWGFNYKIFVKKPFPLTLIV